MRRERPRQDDVPTHSRCCRAVLAVALGGVAALTLAACRSESQSDMEVTPEPGSPSASAVAEATAVPPAATLPPTNAPATTPTRAPTGPLAVPTVVPQIETYAPDPALDRLLHDLLGDAEASYGVYVKSLRDGSGASVNPDKVYQAASLFKLFVMWEAFRQEALGLLSFDDVMEVTAYYKSFELGTNAVQEGDLLTVQEALQLMLTISDTPSGVLLQDTIGVPNINAALEALGIFNSGLFYPGDPLAAARDVGVLIEAIARGGILPAASHDAMVGLLLSARTDNGLRAGVPAGVGVAHKTGSLTLALHDAGIVYLPGGAYVLVVLWDRQGGANLIASISRAVYEYYEAQQ